MTGRMILAVTLILLCACNVTVPQATKLADIVSAASNSEVGSKTEDRYWEVAIEDQGRLMIPRTDSGITIFSTELDAVGFDGWLVRSWGGFDEGHIVRRMVDSDSKTHRLIAGPSELVLECSTFKAHPVGEGEVIWRQECNGQEEPNEVYVDAEGMIIGIYQLAHPDGRYIKMKKRGRGLSVDQY